MTEPTEKAANTEKPANTVANWWELIPRSGGSGFMECSDGVVRWGLFGAAGVVFMHRGQDRIPMVQLQMRSMMAHQGGSWSCAGGAIEPGETALAAGLREAAEEVGEVPTPWREIGQWVFEPATDWSYTTAVVEVPSRFGNSINFETADVAWFSLDEVTELDLHPGFEAAWPHLRKLIENDDQTQTDGSPE